MKILLSLIQKLVRPTKISKEDAFIRIGREQFKKLLEKGLGIPVALL